MTGNQRSGNGSAGLQLLSPTLQQSIEKTPVLSSSHPAEYFGWSTTPPASYAPTGFASNSDNNTDKHENSKDEFDFDGFTLASVRGQKKQASSSSRQSRSNSATRGQFNVEDEFCAYYYNEDKLASSKPPNPLSCSTSSAQTTRTTDDFELLERSRRKLSVSQEQNRFARSSVDTRGTKLTATAAAAGWPMAKKKELTAVVTKGWLQKRKGMVLKRWKAYFCLLKSDDSLCLYTSEDTVNGKLEQRYQILRVVLTDKNDSFHIIGVDAEGAPRREEFRAGVSTEWTKWFQALQPFFDNTSLEQAFLRKPELTFTPAISDKGSEASALSSTHDAVPTGAFDGNQSRNYQPYDERRSYFAPQKMSVRGSFDGMGDGTSTSSSFSSSSVLGLAATRSSNQKLADCPMIERESQKRVPLLEMRGSESTQSTVRG